MDRKFYPSLFILPFKCEPLCSSVKGYYEPQQGKLN